MGDTLLNCAKNNLPLRYSLLKHYYSIFVMARGIGSIYNPLLYIFPLDDNNYKDEIADTQFMVGDSLMGAPILNQGETSREVYFSTINWYDLHTGKKYQANSTAQLTNITLTNKLPIFLREGKIILSQDQISARNTK